MGRRREDWEEGKGRGRGRGRLLLEKVKIGIGMRNEKQGLELKVSE